MVLQQRAYQVSKHPDQPRAEQREKIDCLVSARVCFCRRLASRAPAIVKREDFFAPAFVHIGLQSARERWAEFYHGRRRLVKSSAPGLKVSESHSQSSFCTEFSGGGTFCALSLDLPAAASESIGAKAKNRRAHARPSPLLAND